MLRSKALKHFLSGTQLSMGGFNKPLRIPKAAHHIVANVVALSGKRT